MCLTKGGSLRRGSASLPRPHNFASDWLRHGVRLFLTNHRAEQSLGSGLHIAMRQFLPADW